MKSSCGYEIRVFAIYPEGEEEGENRPSISFTLLQKMLYIKKCNEAGLPTIPTCNYPSTIPVRYYLSNSEEQTRPIHASLPFQCSILLNLIV